MKRELPTWACGLGCSRVVGPPHLATVLRDLFRQKCIKALGIGSDPVNPPRGAAHLRENSK